MPKAIILLLALTVLASAGGQLAFQFGNNLAALTRSGSNYNGVLALNCRGGVGNYRFAISGLPQGWTANQNTITIPNIVNVVGTYVIKARVTDDQGNVVEGDIRLVINGVNVVIQSANGNTDNNIQYSLGGATIVPGSGANGGAPGSGANGGLPGSGSNGGFPGTGSNGGAPGSGAPGSGTPGSGAPGSGTPGSGTSGPGSNGAPVTTGGSPSGPSPSVANLYNNYPGLPTGSSTIPSSGGRYPTPAAPTGNPSTPNIVPQVIANAQAPYNPQRDAKQITPDDVKRNAAFNRQLNANKAVNNLITIIQRLTANVNAAKNDIPTFEEQLRNAQAANNNCNNRVYDLANNATKVQNAIKDRQDKITQANKKVGDIAGIISNLTNNRDQLINSRTATENARSPDAGKLSDLQSQANSCNAAEDALEKKLDDTNAQIADLKGQVKQIQDVAANAPTTIDTINQQLPLIDAKISDLQAQLADAQKQKQNLLNDKLKYQDIISSAPGKISALNNSIRDLTNQIPAIQKQIADQKAACDGLNKQLNDLRNAIAQKESDYKNIVDQIKALDDLIKGKQGEAKVLTDGIAGLPAEIAALQAELARLQDASRNQYYICNDLADAVRKAQQNLDAINNKYKTESGWLNDANLNLEKARAEKELADQGVQEIIASSTNALPFSIVPNGNGLTPAGSPAGNNPSGSPLGPVAERNQVAPGSPVVIGDLNSYLSQAYGAGVDPSRPSTVSTLYPLSSLTLQALTGQSTSGVFNPDGSFTLGTSNGGISGPAVYPTSAAGTSGASGSNSVSGTGSNGANGANGGRNALANFQCGGNSGSGNSGFTQGQGKIISIQPGKIIARHSNGNQIILSIAPCSNLNAVQQNVTLVPQSSIYFKGVQAAPGTINLQQLTCV